MFEGMHQAETERALQFRADHPRPPEPARRSAWATMGELLTSPLTGAAQAVNETLRVASRAMTAGIDEDPIERQQAGPFDLDIGRSERAKSREKRAQMRAEGDAFFKHGAEFWRPDPVASNGASLFLHETGRLLTKAGGYALFGGAPAAVVGTGLDEATTGFLELRDRGVDGTTAAKVGAVRGAATALGIAAPVAGRTALQTLTILGAAGPGTFMAEQAWSRHILSKARYPELAAEHDPFDPIGLGASIAVPGVVAGLVHRARSRAVQRAAAEVSAAPAQGERAPAPPPAADALPDVHTLPEGAVEAAHVVFRDEVQAGHMLGDTTSPQARITHVQAIEDAARALETGEPLQVRVPDVDPRRAAELLVEVDRRLRATEAELAAGRAADAPASLGTLRDGTLSQAEALPPEVRAETAQGVPGRPAEVIGAARDPLPGSTPAEASGTAATVAEAARLREAELPSEPLRRGQRIADEQPALPVRLDDAGPSTSAPDLMHAARMTLRRDRDDARAYVAAVECFIRTGS